MWLQASGCRHAVCGQEPAARDEDGRRVRDGQLVVMRVRHGRLSEPDAADRSHRAVEHDGVQDLTHAGVQLGSRQLVPPKAEPAHDVRLRGRMKAGQLGVDGCQPLSVDGLS
jgi:hypothetical protein